MHEDRFYDFVATQHFMWTKGWRCLNCGHAVDPTKEADRRLHHISNDALYPFPALSSLWHSEIVSRQPAQCPRHPTNWNRRMISAVCLLIAAGVHLLGCASAGKEVLAERAERQELEKAYTQAQEALTAQAAASRAEHQKLEKVYTQVKEALTKQAGASQELDRKLARLQLLSLEKEAQNKELNIKLEEAIVEVVRAKAKLRSLETKAEAASTLAEGEIALKTLKTHVADVEADTNSIKAEELLKASELELKNENYSGALYLATQAKALIREDQERSKDREKKPMMAGEVPFTLPLPLRVISQTKVKEGPGVDSKVLFSVQQGTALVGYSFKGPWVHVRGEDGRSGWIYYNLISGR
jgi:hypothetical protein